MNKLSLLYIFAYILSTCLYSQAERKFEIRKKNDIIEEYYLLKDNKKIKDGNYLKYKHTRAGISILESGFYKNNFKDSIWEFYYPDFPLNSLQEKGKYTRGIKNGEWKTFYLDQNKNLINSVTHNENKRKVDSLSITIYDSLIETRSHGVYYNNKKLGLWRYFDKGELVLEFNHSSNEIIYNRKNIFEYTENDSISKPYYIGGTEYLLFLLNKRIFPQPFHLKQGKVTIEFSIDKNGTAKDFYIKMNSSKKSFGKIILNEVKNLPHDWIPSFSNGIIVESTYRIITTLEYADSKDFDTISYGSKIYKMTICLDY